jgi:hypothetical protein
MALTTKRRCKITAPKSWYWIKRSEETENRSPWHLEQDLSLCQIMKLDRKSTFSSKIIFINFEADLLRILFSVARI